MTETHVVTCFLRNRSDVLLLKRSAAVGSYQGKWGAVAGYAEGDPERAVRREIAEETGLHEAVTMVRKGTPFPVEDADLDTRWIVHPYLFDCDRRDVRLDEESVEMAWVSPTEILRRDTVPQLWTTYESIAPSLKTVRSDREHGSAYISIRALEVLRDEAARQVQQPGPDSGGTLRRLAQELIEVRPAMTALENRIHRAMHVAGADPTPLDIEVQVVGTVERAFQDDEEATKRAANYIAGRRVFTLSHSQTVIRAILTAEPRPPSVVIATSHPGGEGISVAEQISRSGIDVTLIPDAALAYAFTGAAEIEVVLLGADTVLANGDVVNKTGTHHAALLARKQHIPCYIATASDKISTRKTPRLEQASREEVYEGSAILQVVAPLFEVTPAHLFSGLITEYGIVGMNEVSDIASELRSLAQWLEW